MKKTLSMLLAVVMILTAFTAAAPITSATAATNLSTPMITDFVSLDSGVKITWGKVPYAEKYRVYYKGRNGWTKMGETSSNSFVDTDVSSGSTYTYTVRCMNAKMTEFTSGYYSAGWKYTYNMDTPQITKIESKSGGVNITWDKVPNASKYRVYYKNSKGNWVKMATTSSTSYLDKDVQFGSTYTYTVRCIKADESRFTSSFNSNGWKHTHYLDTPQITDFDSLDSGVKITWDKVPNAEKYRVYYKGRNGWTKMGETSSDSFVDTDVSSGSTYTYTVRCVNSQQTKFTSGFNASGWRYTYNMDTPQITKLESLTNGVKITWGKVPNATKYRVYYKNGNGNWVKMATTSSTSYLDTDVRQGKAYTYTVRCIKADETRFTSSFNNNGWRYVYSAPAVTPTQPVVKPTEAPKPTQPPTQPATQAPTVKPADPTPTATVTPTVHVYDGKISVSWDAVTGATKYVVKTYFASQGINKPFDTKTVTTTSTTMNHVFTKKANQSYYGETFLTAVIAYKNNTAVTTAKPVSTTTVYKAISERDAERIRTIFTVGRDINFCNTCGKWMKNAYQTNLMGKISPDEACMNHQTYHSHADGCGAGSYRCWTVQWPSGLMNYDRNDDVGIYKYYSIVDTNWNTFDYPTVTTAPSISSIQKVSYTKEIHPQQLDNTMSESEKTDPEPLMQADGALEISFKPTDSSIKIYDIWVKTTDAKSVNKLTQIPQEGDKIKDADGTVHPLYNVYDGRWTYDEKYNDWAVIGFLVVDNNGYTSYCHALSDKPSYVINKTVSTSNLSTLVYTLPNWYGNEYNSCYDWNMLDNNTKYEFAIQPRIDRHGGTDKFRNVPAAPRGQSKSYTWTGRDYEYYTENNAYLQGASMRNTNIKTKPLEVYAEQRNLNWKTWGNFELWLIKHDDRTGKDYITQNGGIGVINSYRIPARTDFNHDGANYLWKGIADNGVYALSTRTACISNSSSHTEGNTATFTIGSYGLYARTPMYDIWSKRNDYGKHITLIDHKIPYYDPLCYEYTIDGGYRYYYEDIIDSWVKQRPSNYTPAVPDSKATRKSTNEHLYESEIAKK